VTRWQPSVRASTLTRRLPLAATIAVGLVLASLGAGCGATGTPKLGSPAASPSATGQTSLLLGSQSKGGAPLLAPGTYRGELGGTLPNGRRNAVAWYKVRLSASQQTISLQLTVPQGAIYYVEIVGSNGTVVNKGTFAGPQFGISAPASPGLFYLRLEQAQGKGAYKLVITFS
jgi:hypothetical protein